MTNTLFHVMCTIIKNIIYSAAKAQTGRIYMGGQRARPMGTAEIDPVRPQPVKGNPFYTNNSTAKGILTASLRQKLPKALGMRFYWMCDQIKRGHLNLA